MTGEDWTEARRVRWDMTDEARSMFRQLYQGEWVHEPTEPIELSPPGSCPAVPCPSFQETTLSVDKVWDASGNEVI